MVEKQSGRRVQVSSRLQFRNLHTRCILIGLNRHSDWSSMCHHKCTRLSRRNVEQRDQRRNGKSRKDEGACKAREKEPKGDQGGGLWQLEAKAAEAQAEGVTGREMKRRTMDSSHEEILRRSYLRDEKTNVRRRLGGGMGLAGRWMNNWAIRRGLSSRSESRRETCWRIAPFSFGGGDSYGGLSEACGVRKVD